MEYLDFLATKRIKAKAAGFEPVLPINPKLFDWQGQIVRWALRLGRAALFESYGLGKTAQQLEWARHVVEHTNGNVLILAPLCVASQTRREGEKFGIEVTAVRSQEQVKPGINITNYEMLDKFDAKAFAGIVLDESSILKAFMGKTKRKIIDAFEHTRFKLACTATPAPNDHMELQNHAEFLGVEGHGEMLAVWFINDTMEAGAYRLKKHSEKDFWRWVASWAVSISKPSDLGYSDEGFNLPPLNFHQEIVEVDINEDCDGMLFRMPSLSATGIHKEMRRTCEERALRAGQLVMSHPGPWAVWCNTNYEADALRAAIPGAVEVRGNESIANKEKKANEFTDGNIRVLISKASIFGYGMNWQHCHKVIVAGLSYSYEDLDQLIHRFHRFGQVNPVDCHVIMAETEGPVFKVIERKREDHTIMKDSMVEAMKEVGLAADSRQGLAPVEEAQFSGENWTVHQGDNCQTIKRFPDNIVGLTVSSLPFENLYIYSDIEADMGNSRDGDEFFAHMGYLIPELLRITIPGRLCVMHCKDLPLYKGRDGAAGLRDFPGEIVRAFELGGWTFHSRCTIWKDPVTEMQRTKNHGLLYKNLCADSACSRQGMADYLLVFRKWSGGEFTDPVKGSNPERFDRYIGMEPPDPTAIADEHALFRPIPNANTGAWPNINPFELGSEAYRQWSIKVWQKYASPVWFDINQMDVLPYKEARGEDDERHICPLQLGVISRCVHLWSNPGDVVFDPFTGVGSSLYEAINLGRRGLGIELKPNYVGQAVKNLTLAEQEINKPMLALA